VSSVAENDLDTMPLAYAEKKAYFRYLELGVDQRVLIPRPETEVLVDEVLGYAKDNPGGIVIDVGTGSGAIALSLAQEGSFDRVIAIDVSPDALELASQNAACVSNMRCPVEFREGSFLEPVRDVRARIVVSNPPYIAYSEACELPQSVIEWEPHLALFSDDNGLAATAEIICGAAGVLEMGGLLALEVDTRRALRVAEMIKADGRYDSVVVRPDLTRRDRFVLARRV
jgi:release factor glutamine methyltransferase